MGQSKSSLHGLTSSDFSPTTDTWQWLLSFQHFKCTFCILGIFSKTRSPVTRTWKMTQITHWPGDPVTRFHVWCRVDGAWQVGRHVSQLVCWFVLLSGMSCCRLPPHSPYVYIRWQWRNFIPYLCRLFSPPSCGYRPVGRGCVACIHTTQISKM